MSEYVSSIFLEVNGQSVSDFKSCTEKAIDVHGQVNLMNKTGFIKKTPRYGVSVEYVVPEDGTEFDWESVANGRLTIERANGKRRTFTGVYVLSVGDGQADGDNEMTRTIDLGASGRIDE